MMKRIKGDSVEIKGCCHCGAISYTYYLPEECDHIPARACGCDFCQRHGGCYTSNPKAALDVSIGDTTNVHIYRFATETADFHVCKNCGVVPMVTCRLDETLYAVVNVNCFLAINSAMIVRSASDFEDEAKQARLNRRKTSWIPCVRWLTQT